MIFPLLGLDFTSRTIWRGVSLPNSGHLRNVWEIKAVLREDIDVPGRQLSITR